MPTFSPEDRALIGRWKGLLKWEQENPLNLKADERPTLISRVEAAYRKAVTRMRFYPEIWYATTHHMHPHAQ